MSLAEKLVFLFLFYLFFEIAIKRPKIDSNNNSSIKTDVDKENIIIDVDAGADDGFALLMLFKHEKITNNLNIMAITCTHGNTQMNHIQNNVMKVLHFSGKTDIPIYLGADDPLVFKQETDNYFGNDGFGDFEYQSLADFPQPKQEHAVLKLIELVNNNQEQITIFALGPLTNIALAVKLDPNFINKLKKLVICGGSVAGIGNIKTGIEFNHFMDPEAAAIVFQASNYDKVDLFPYDTVYNAKIPMDWRINELNRLGDEDVMFMDKAEMIFQRTTEKYWTPSDLMTLYCYFWPESILEIRPLRVTGITCGEDRGGLEVGRYQEDVKSSNVRAILNFDAEKFKNQILEYFYSNNIENDGNSIEKEL